MESSSNNIDLDKKKKKDEKARDKQLKKDKFLLKQAQVTRVPTRSLQHDKMSSYNNQSNKILREVINPALQIEKLEKITSAPDYAEKVMPNVRAKNKETLDFLNDRLLLEETAGLSL